MRTYYRGPDVLITDQAFVWRTGRQRVYLVRDLQHVVMIRGDLDPARSVSAHVAGGALILVGAAWPLLDNPVAMIVATLVVVMPVTASIVSWRRRPRLWELRATYEGQQVVLFASADLRTFNQVGRGLRRAIEDSGGATAWYELAAH
jgi:hypothetical protein